MDWGDMYKFDPEAHGVDVTAMDQEPELTDEEGQLVETHASLADSLMDSFNAQ